MRLPFAFAQAISPISVMLDERFSCFRGSQYSVSAIPEKPGAL